MKRKTDEPNQDVGARIRQARRATGLSQWQLAAQTGLQRLDLYRLEQGRVDPAVPVLEAIAAALQLDMTWLTTGQGKGPAALAVDRLSGAEVRRIREAAELTRDELAAYLGIAATTLRAVELGHQDLGPVASKVVLKLKNGGLAEATWLRDRTWGLQLVEASVAEVYRLTTSPKAMAAIEQLAATLGRSPQEVLTDLVQQRVLQPEDNPASACDEAADSE